MEIHLNALLTRLIVSVYISEYARLTKFLLEFCARLLSLEWDFSLHGMVGLKRMIGLPGLPTENIVLLPKVSF